MRGGWRRRRASKRGSAVAEQRKLSRLRGAVLVCQNAARQTLCRLRVLAMVEMAMDMAAEEQAAAALTERVTDAVVESEFAVAEGRAIDEEVGRIIAHQVTSLHSRLAADAEADRLAEKATFAATEAVVQAELAAAESAAVAEVAVETMAAQVVEAELSDLIEVAAVETQKRAEATRAEAWIIVKVQALWRGIQARRQVEEQLSWWDFVIEEDAATRIQAAWRGRRNRFPRMRQLAAQVISPEGVEPEETVVWEGGLEKAVERDESGTKRKGGWRLFDAMRGKDDYSWQAAFAVLFSGGDCPRIELFGSKTAAEAEAAEPETFALRGAQLLQEPEDKHATVLLCLTQPGLDGEDQVLRLRVTTSQRWTSRHERKHLPTGSGCGSGG